MKMKEHSTLNIQRSTPNGIPGVESFVGSSALNVESWMFTTL